MRLQKLVRIQKFGTITGPCCLDWRCSECTLDLDVSIRIRKGTGQAEVAADLSKHQHYSKLCQVPE